MKRSSRVFGTPIYLNGSPSISMNGANTIEVIDGAGSSVECVAFNVENASVNVLEFNATATGNSPSIEATGDDANIDVSLTSKGTGIVNTSGNLGIGGSELIDINGNSIITLNPTGGAVNRVEIQNAATGNSPQINGVGDDADVGIQLAPKGIGAVDVASELWVQAPLQFTGATKEIWAESPATGGKAVLGLLAADNAVNYVQVNGTATGVMPGLEATGTDADINLQLVPKGTGYVQAVGDLKLDTNNIRDSNNNLAAAFTATGSAVNYLQVDNAATGNGIALSSVGTDDHIDLAISPKGDGLVEVNSDLDVTGMLVIDANQSYGGGPTTLGSARQTTDDTPTVLQATEAIPEGTVVSVTVDVVAVETDESNRALYKLSGLFYRNTSGNITQQGATVSLNTVETDAAWDCDFVMNAGAQTIDVTVTGAAATTVNWKGVLNINVVMTA